MSDNILPSIPQPKCLWCSLFGASRRLEFTDPRVLPTAALHRNPMSVPVRSTFRRQDATANVEKGPKYLLGLS